MYILNQIRFLSTKKKLSYSNQEATLKTQIAWLFNLDRK